MNRVIFWAKIGAIAATLTVLGFGPGPKDSDALPPPGSTPPPGFRGAGSCSATACHGGPFPAEGRVLRNEHTTWIRRDRHADAFAVLFGERSRSIAANLSNGAISADKDARCLACHSSPRREPVEVATPILLSEGVGCESCHGPADRWIGPHTRWDWASRPTSEKERLGMIETADLGRRAGICSGCHVGEPARDGRPSREVDHEMLAAGHPRLNFELSAYLATMPHHWRDEIGPDASADFPARAWVIGQLASGKAAVDLTGDRANRSRPGPAIPGRRKADWPELSEFSCFSCHHSLRDEAWRRGRREGPGSPQWGSWPFAMLPDLDPSTEGRALSDGIKSLRSLMSAPRPDPAEVSRMSDLVSGLLDRRLKATEGRALDIKQVEALLNAVRSTTTRGEPSSWEEATQRYLSMVPLNQSLRSLDPTRADPRTLEELARLRDLLRFPTGSDSPKGFDPTRAPDGFRPF